LGTTIAAKQAAIIGSSIVKLAGALERRIAGEAERRRR